MEQALRTGRTRVPFRADALARGREAGAAVSLLARPPAEAQELCSGKYLARYRDRDGFLVYARNALGRPIVCDSEELALSVSCYRSQRLKPFEEYHAN